MRLIDADALRIRFMLPDAQIKGLGLETVIAVRDVMDFIKTAPTVEPKRGRWIKSETLEAFDIAGVKTWALKAKCSECGFVHKFIKAHMCYGYCPQCGAAMKEGETDETD